MSDQSKELLNDGHLVNASLKDEGSHFLVDVEITKDGIPQQAASLSDGEHQHHKKVLSCSGESMPRFCSLPCALAWENTFA